MPVKRPACRFATVANRQSILSNTGTVDTWEHKAGGMKQKATGGEWRVRIPQAEEVMNAECPARQTKL
jgi:hypothetical protein